MGTAIKKVDTIEPGPLPDIKIKKTPAKKKTIKQVVKEVIAKWRIRPTQVVKAYKENKLKPVVRTWGNGPMTSKPSGCVLMSLATAKDIKRVRAYGCKLSPETAASILGLPVNYCRGVIGGWDDWDWNEFLSQTTNWFYTEEAIAEAKLGWIDARRAKVKCEEKGLI